MKLGNAVVDIAALKVWFEGGFDGVKIWFEGGFWFGLQDGLSWAAV